MSKIKYSFMKGMNRDISKNRFPTSSYYYLENGRILTDDGATSTNIVSVKGNSTASILTTLYPTTTSRIGFVIIGSVTILDNIILFYATENTTIDDYNSISVIDVLEYAGEDTYQRRECWKGFGLNFRSDKPITAESRYDQSNIQKVYWTDNNNVVKQCNIGVDISTTVASEFDFTGELNKAPKLTFNNYTSGSLKQGVISYAYKFVKLNGYSSVYSQVGEVIPLGRNISDNLDISRLEGDDTYVSDNPYSSNHGVVLTLDITNSDILSYYDYVEVVSLWRSTDTGVPSISIVDTLQLTSTVSSYSIVDEGTSNYGSVEYSDFLSQVNDFTAKDLAIKDNRLFAANITDVSFDIDEELGSYWDARAYRFDSTGKCELYNANGALKHTLNKATPNYSSIPETADAVNPFNNISDTIADQGNSTGNNQSYGETAQGNFVSGGTGLNVNYYFTPVTSELVKLDVNTPNITGTYNNKYQSGMYKSLQYDDVYRVGIVFFDKKGRQSFTKWIGDIRTPSISDAQRDLGRISGVGQVSVDNLHLYVELLNGSPIIDGHQLDWQIVYVKREKKDKGVQFSGLYNTATQIDSQGISSFEGRRAGIGLYEIKELNTGDTAPLIMSPDINFKKDEFLNVDFIQTSGVYSQERSMYKKWDATAYNSGIKNLRLIGRDSFESIINLPCLAPRNIAEKRVIVYDQIKVIPQTSNEFTSVVGSTEYANYVLYVTTSPDDDDNFNGVATTHGTAMAYDHGSTLADINGVAEGYHYVYARKDVFESQYGGLSYSSRALNTYIALGERINGNVDNVTCKYGDIFLTYYEYNRLLKSPIDETINEYWNHRQMETVGFICETDINCLLRNDDTYSKHYNDIAATDRYDINQSFINESAIVTTGGITYTGLYDYNDAYSSINNTRSFYVKPINFNSKSENNTMIKYSDVKLGTEDEDNWLQFRTNNYNEADKNHGSINKLVEFNDRVFTFQNNAVAIVSINPRVTQQSDDGVTISLGTGEVIDSFKYLTTDIGCQDNSDIIKSLSAMYWLDKNKKKVYSFGQGMSSVTDMNGMHSYLKNNISEKSEFRGVYDIANSEVLMTVTDEFPNTIFTTDLISEELWLVSGYGFDITNQDFLIHDFVLNGIYFLDDGYYEYKGRDNFAGVDGFTFQFLGGKQFNYNIIDLSPYIQEKDNFTLAYSEKIQAFSSFYSFIPSMYIKHNKGFFSTANLLDLYQHDINLDYNTFYGEYHPLVLRVILNMDNNQMEFTNISLFTEVEDSSGNDFRNETVTEIMTKNKYQQSEIIKLYPKSLSEDGSNGPKYVMDTSSTKIGSDYYVGKQINLAELLDYNGELYRSLINNNSGDPDTNPLDFEVAELCNTNKTVEHWNMQIPRVVPIDILSTEHSNRMRGDYVELTLMFNKPLTPNKKIKISDLNVLSYRVIY